MQVETFNLIKPSPFVLPVVGRGYRFRISPLAPSLKRREIGIILPEYQPLQNCFLLPLHVVLGLTLSRILYT